MNNHNFAQFHICWLLKPPLHLMKSPFCLWVVIHTILILWANCSPHLWLVISYKPVSQPAFWNENLIQNHDLFSHIPITIPLRQHFPVDFLPFNLVKTIVKHPFANGNHTTFLKMVIWAMVQMALSYPDYIVFSFSVLTIYSVSHRIHVWYIC